MPIRFKLGERRPLHTLEAPFFLSKSSNLSNTGFISVVRTLELPSDIDREKPSPLAQRSSKMATPDVYVQLGTPDQLFSKIINSPRLNPSPKETQESLKRSFAKYLAGDNMPPPVGKLFNPSKHLTFEEPSYVHTMEDIGYPSSNGVSPIAVSEPFRLFSEEAVNIMRDEILDPEVQEKYSYQSDIAPRQIRGYAPK
jgi:hypothetical protein